MVPSVLSHLKNSYRLWISSYKSSVRRNDPTLASGIVSPRAECPPSTGKISSNRDRQVGREAYPPRTGCPPRVLRELLQTLVESSKHGKTKLINTFKRSQRIKVHILKDFRKFLKNMEIALLLSKMNLIEC